MNAMRPDEIQREMERQRAKDLSDIIFAILMLVVLPIAFIGMIMFS